MGKAIGPPARKLESDRYRQLRRTLAICELLRQFRFGCDIHFIHREINKRTEQNWCWRTIHRDLNFLRTCGLIESQSSAGGPDRWLWCGDERPASPLGKVRPESITPDVIREVHWRDRHNENRQLQESQEK